jgi:plastocyanin
MLFTVSRWFSCWLVLLNLSVAQAQAVEIQVVDQHGAAVEGVVVMAPSGPANFHNEVTIVDQVGKQFLPKVQLIQVGTQVSFPNSDSIRHHVYSFSEEKKFEIRLYSGIPAQPILFDKPGLVVMGCNIHDAMVGYIVVADNHFIAKTDSQGMLQLPAASSEIQLWHPLLLRIDQPVNVELSRAQSPQTVVVPIKSESTAPKARFGNKLIRHAR